MNCSITPDNVIAEAVESIDRDNQLRPSKRRGRAERDVQGEVPDQPLATIEAPSACLLISVNFLSR